MPRYVAFLRGVSPMNAKMPELKRCIENAGFDGVRTLLSSGNVVFTSRATSESRLEQKLEAAMADGLGHAFYTIVRRVDELNEMLTADPYAAFELMPGAKRVVTFMRTPHSVDIELPLEFDDARILAVAEREVFSVYVPSPRGPAFMALIEKTFGKNVTTRTWDTVKKCAAA
ncbi:MAG: DUF1697 domain-containing protein [Trinickia sp.]|uniref:DUF1697 domain-containing protein n=1 Tax=Trinickia sp. TaxID=2571163 RepID=UPI003F7F08B5